jgi:leucyl-tRNA synthetase
MKQIPHKFSPAEFEQRWQEWWEEKKVYRTPEIEDIPRKSYILDMFPYPSAQGLHVGHPEGYTATDIYSRYLRMKDYQVLHPMGWDAFGLPAENYAIKQGIHPKITTNQAIENFRRQIKALGFSYDWEKELATCDPNYYKWTQWLFEILYKEGLAYKKKAPVNWCPSCQTVLANEQVVDGKCERCHSAVIQKEIAQWFFKITAFADELLSDLDKIDWPISTKVGQTNWIGRSEGLLIKFPVISVMEEDDQNIGKASVEQVPTNSQKSPLEIEIFTTRPDTIYGATFLVLAPEHPQVIKLTNSIHMPQVVQYIEKTKHKTRLQRTDLVEKSGVFSGAYALNPITQEKTPIYISDYVVMDYGTGAIMGVPAHDKRDWDFAKKMKIDIKPVCVTHETYNKLTRGNKMENCSGNFSQIREIINANSGTKLPQDEKNATTPDTYFIDQLEVFGLEFPHENFGVCINSGKYSSLSSEECITKISKDIILTGFGNKSIKYKLRDWLISRQRYWGAPIPIIYCEMCGENLVSESELPVLLPEDVDFRPTGESPLVRSKSFHHVKCPKCGGSARRESDTMDTFVCSSWYFFAFTFWEKIRSLPANSCLDSCGLPVSSIRKNPLEIRKNQGGKVSNIYEVFTSEIAKWLPVDLYVGGAEHTVLHLLYSRFITKALHRAGLIQFDEPFMKLRHIGMILGLDGQKMSKSRGNVINPDEIVNKFGADTMRLYEMFMGPLSEKKAWNMHGVEGCFRFLSRIWHLVNEIDRKILDCENERIWQTTQELILKVENDIKDMKFNTAIAKMMSWLNETVLLTANFKPQDVRGGPARQTVKESLKVFLRVLAPFAPHLAEELNFKLSACELNNYKSIHLENWPAVDKDTIITTSDKVFLVEVNGRVVEKIAGDFFNHAEPERPKGVEGEGSPDEQMRLKKHALSLPKIQSRLAGRTPTKVIFVPGKLINFVV